ncbi:T1SS secreted agglutinin RTX [Vibrio sp. JCM 19236]|nr:T1SS secreted agglutinin RTX [Vibrio sp. JCM 19236]
MVTGENDAPTAVDDSYQTQEYQPVLIDPLANDFDVDGDEIFIVSISVLEDQGVVYQDEGGQYYFQPAEGFSGEATISYTMQDELGLQDSAEIKVSVEEINEAPEITVTPLTVTEGEASVGDPVADYETYDEEGDELEVDFTPGTNDDRFYELVDGQVVLTQPGVDWVNAGNVLPPVDLTVKEVNSDLSGSDNGTPTVNLENDAPTIEITPLTVFENQTDEGDAVAAYVTSDEENDEVIVSFAPGSNTDGYYALEDGKVVLTSKGAEFVNAGNALPLIALVVTETKAGGLSGSDDGTPTVVEANDPPEITVVAGMVTEDATNEGDEVATYTINDEDEDQLEVDFTPGTNDDGFYELVNGKVVLTEKGANWVNAGNELPPVDLTVREVGSEGLTDSASDTPTVNTVNDKPVLTVTDTNDFIENQASENDVVAKYETYDEDGDEVTVTLSDETYYKLDDDGNVLLTEEGADLVNSGQELPPFTLTPNDGTVDGDAETVDPSVTEVNDKPVLTVTETNDFIENQASENDVVAKYETYDQDGDEVTVTLSDETYYKLDDDGNVLLTEAGADLVNSGQELPPFTLTPNDGTVDGDAETVDPSVTEVNDAPEFISGSDIAGGPVNDDSYDFGSVVEAQLLAL